MWNIFVQVQDKRHNVQVEPNQTVEQLIKIIWKKLVDTKVIQESTPATDIQLLFGATVMSTDDTTKLSDYKMKDGSPMADGMTVILSLTMNGGTSRLRHLFTAPSSNRDNNSTLKPLPPYITVTSLEKEPDMITQDGDPTEKRAKMPCGHVISRESMTSWCRSLLDQGKFTFHCPFTDAANRICKSEWPYFLVRHVALLTEEEMHRFETCMTENYSRKASGLQQCPRCKMWCTRRDESSNNVRCSICTSSNGVPFDFCWVCLNEWKIGGQKCGNSECNGQDARLRILSTCLEKQIGGVIVPSIRGCPNCGILIEHKEACKHMTCEVCKYEFCFLCLQRYRCSNCQLVPRQTALCGT